MTNDNSVGLIGPSVFFVDDRVKCSLEVKSQEWTDLAFRVLSDLGISAPEVEMSIYFVDIEEIESLNKEYLGVDSPTDVLSFPIEDVIEIKKGVPLLLGDVIICPAVASQQATKNSRSFEREISHLLIHGILHLLGYDHVLPKERKVMEDKEENLLERYFL